MPILAGSSEFLPHALYHSILLPNTTCIYNTRHVRAISRLYIFHFIFWGFIVPIFFIIPESSFPLPQILAADGDANISPCQGLGSENYQYDV